MASAAGLSQPPRPEHTGLPLSAHAVEIQLEQRLEGELRRLADFQSKIDRDAQEKQKLRLKIGKLASDRDRFMDIAKGFADMAKRNLETGENQRTVLYCFMMMFCCCVVVKKTQKL